MCVFTPSADDGDTTKTSTSAIDGTIDGKRSSTVGTMLACTIPPIANGQTANVTFEWGSGDTLALFPRGDGANVLYSASWYTGITLVEGHPIISGIGFSPNGDYTCLFSLSSSKDQTDSTTAVFISSNQLRCNVDLDPKGPILKAYNGNPKTTVIVRPQIGKDGKGYKDLSSEQPKSIPFDAGFSKGKSLQYKYIDTACGDGVKVSVKSCVNSVAVGPPPSGCPRDSTVMV